MDWWHYSLLNSFVMAAYFGLNGWLRISGLNLVLCRSIVAAAIGLPFVLTDNTPFTQAMLIGGIGTGIVAAVADSIMFSAVAKYGGAMITRLMPLKIWSAFALWLIVSPASFWLLWADKPRFAAILITLSIGIIAMMYLKKCDVSRAALRMIVPVLVLLTFADVLHKYAMDGQYGLAPAIQFMFLISAVMTLTTVVIKAAKRESFTELLDKKHLHAAWLGGGIFFTLIVVRSLAMAGVPNPAYTSAIAALASVWLYIIHKMRKQKDESNVFAGFVIVVTSVVLLLLTK